MSSIFRNFWRVFFYGHPPPHHCLHHVDLPRQHLHRRGLHLHQENEGQIVDNRSAWFIGSINNVINSYWHNFIVWTVWLITCVLCPFIFTFLFPRIYFRALLNPAACVFDLIWTVVLCRQLDRLFGSDYSHPKYCSAEPLPRKLIAVNLMNLSVLGGSRANASLGISAQVFPKGFAKVRPLTTTS